MADLASLGLAVDSSQILAADKALVNLTSSGKGAQLAADLLSAAAMRLNTQYEIANRTQNAYNDNLRRNQQAQNQNSTYWTETAAKIGIAAAAYYTLSSAIGAVSDSASSANAKMVEFVSSSLVNLKNKFMDVWKEGTDRLDKYIKLSNDAGTLTTDFYQKIAKGATDAKIPIENVLRIIENTKQALDPKLGGSSFANQIAGLTSVGNLQGQQSEIANLKSASNPEAQFAASAKLIQSAMDAGERLVALDLTKSLWGEEARQRLAENSDYIYKITTAINTAKDKEFITQPEVDHAVGLKIALEGAYKAYDEMIKKNQGEIGNQSALGIRLQEIWVNLVTGYVGALLWLDKIFSSTEKIANIKPQQQSEWDKFFISFGEFFDQLSRAERTMEVLKTAAENTLASRMQNPQNVKNAMAESQKISDTFDFKPVEHKAIDESTVAILQYVDATKLATSVVGLSAAEAKRLEVEHQLTAAAIRDGLDPAVERLTAKWNLLREEAILAADAMEQATKKQAGIVALTAKFKAGEDSYKASQDSNQEYINQTKISIELNKQVGALKERQVIESLRKSALAAGRSDVSSEDLAKAKEAGKLAQQLSDLNAPKDAYDRATDQLLRYIKTTEASTEALGKNAGAQEKLKAMAQLRAGLEKDGVTETEAQTKAMEKLADRAAVAAQKVADVQIAFTIKRGRDTAFLTQEDVAIADQLSKKYPDIAQALGSMEAQGIRTNNAMRNLATTLETNLTSGLVEIAMGTKKASQGFKDMSLAVIKALEEMLIKALVVKPIMDSLNNSVSSSGILSFLGLGGASGALNANGSIAGAVGATSVGGAPLIGLHGGGIVGSEATFTRSVDLSNWNNAPRFHGGGIAGDEVPIIAKRGEGVFTEGQMAKMGGGGGMNVTYAPVYQLTGTAEEIEKIKAAAAQDRAQFSSNVVDTIRRAQKGRVL